MDKQTNNDDDNENYLQLQTETNDNSLFSDQTTPKSTDEAYLNSPNKNILKTEGSELPVTGNKLTSNPSNDQAALFPSSPEATDQFADLSRRLGASDANANLYMPLGKISRNPGIKRSCYCKVVY